MPAHRETMRYARLSIGPRMCIGVAEGEVDVEVK